MDRPDGASQPDPVERARALCDEARVRALQRLERHLCGPRKALGRRASGPLSWLGLVSDGPEVRSYERCEQLLQDAERAVGEADTLDADGADEDARVQAWFVAKARFDGLDRQLSAIERRHRAQRFD